MGSHSVSPWFAIQVAPQCETRVSTLLEYKGYQPFFPTHKVRRRRSDRMKILDQPLFPGYVFCRSLGKTDGLIVATPHVIRIVAFGGKPAVVEDWNIDALRKIGDSEAGSLPCSYSHHIGEHVRIMNGPFSGLTGVLIQTKKQHRLVISIDAIMKSVSVQVDAMDIYPTRWL